MPSRRVLISPALDLTLSNPAIQSIDDPVLPSVPVLQQRYVSLWAGDLPLTDPLVSPLFGSLAGLPPTAVYSGNLYLFSPDALALQDKALATPGGDFTFILRNGQVHDWLVVPLLPETIAARPDINQQLGIGPDASFSLPTVNPLAGQITNGLITPTLNSQAMDPVTAAGRCPTCARVGPDFTHAAQRHRSAGHFAGEPSLVSQVFTGFYRVRVLHNAFRTRP